MFAQTMRGKTAGRARAVLIVFSLAAHLQCASRPSAAPASGRVIQETGVALTPKSFPQHTPADVQEMFDKGKELGNYAIFIYQWSQLDSLDVPRAMVAQCAKSGITPVLGLSPTVLSGLRGSFDVPAPVRRQAKDPISFADPVVHQAFIKTALDLAALKPPYLCLATEINLLAFNDIQAYITLAHVYKKLYPEIKKVSPKTRLFVSFQWDFMQILDRKEPGKIKEHTKLIDIFRPELDVIALTSYPADHFAAPADVPADYYAKIHDHVGAKDDVMFMEIGWPTTGKGSEQEQLEFIQRLPSLMQDVKPSILAWSLLHDVKTSALGGDLASTGLLTPDGRPKQSFAAFKELSSK